MSADEYILAFEEFLQSIAEGNENAHADAAEKYKEVTGLPNTSPLILAFRGFMGGLDYAVKYAGTKPDIAGGQ